MQLLSVSKAVVSSRINQNTLFKSMDTKHREWTYRAFNQLINFEKKNTNEENLKMRSISTEVVY